MPRNEASHSDSVSTVYGFYNSKKGTVDVYLGHMQIGSGHYRNIQRTLPRPPELE